MKTLTALTIALSASCALLADFPSLPIHVPCGQIVTFEKTDKPQPFVDFDLAAEAGQQDPADTLPEQLVRKKRPDAAMTYAVFTVSLLPGRTLSSYDFILENDRGFRVPCLGMGRENTGFYDFRLKVQTGPQRLKLIFACPANSYEVRLKPAFPNLPIQAIGDFKISDRPKPAPKAKADAKAKDAKGQAPAKSNVK